MPSVRRTTETQVQARRPNAGTPTAHANKTGVPPGRRGNSGQPRPALRDRPRVSVQKCTDMRISPWQLRRRRWTLTTELSPSVPAEKHLDARQGKAVHGEQKGTSGLRAASATLLGVRVVLRDGVGRSQFSAMSVRVILRHCALRCQLKPPCVRVVLSCGVSGGGALLFGLPGRPRIGLRVPASTLKRKTPGSSDTASALVVGFIDLAPYSDENGLYDLTFRSRHLRRCA